MPIFISFPKTSALKGSVEDEGPKDAISVLSMSHHVSLPLSGAFAGGQSRHSGKASFGDITFSKYVDEVTPQFNVYAAGGEIIKSAVFQWYNTDGSKNNKYMEITITDVIISSISYSGSAGSDNPIENISLNFATISWTYNQEKNKAPGGLKGDVTTTWDLFKNTK